MAVMLIVFSAVGPRLALAACNPGRQIVDGVWFAGTQKTPANVPRNVRADIEEYNPFQATGPATSVWTMLNRGGNDWAQIGWWNRPGFGRSTFVQWTDGNGHWFTETFAASSVGTLPTYQTIYNPGPNSEFVFEKNNAVLWRVSPTNWVPTTAQMHGETHSKHDQMPGGFNSPVWMDRAQYTVGGGWIDMNTAAGVTDGIMHGALKASSKLYKIWDKACAS